MGSRKPDRRTVVEREFPVRLTIACITDPGEMEGVRLWLARHVGSSNYGTTPGVTWSQRVVHIHFRDLHAASMFVMGVPAVRLIGERYDGPTR